MEHQHHEPELDTSSPPGAKVHERALELNTDSFLKRIENIKETDPELASDLMLAVGVADRVRVESGETLVVGGFVRDDALSLITGRQIESKDIDLEIYGIEFDRLKETLADFGKVNIVGDHFVVAQLRNEETGNDLDCSIPRRDSKAGVGHKGFVIDGDPTMSPREAARRRDFTINSLALNPRTGELHDDFGGLEDLKRGILRATDMDLFADDPLRVLRAMQFTGRFELTIDPETAELCRRVNITELPRERVGEEWNKLMLKAEHPGIGLEAARELGVLDKLHPDLAILDEIEQEYAWHPEGNVWNHTVLAVNAAARIVREESLTEKEALIVMYGTLCHDLGKATTTKRIRTKDGTMRITARGHDVQGVEPTKRFLHQIYQDKDITSKVLPIVRGHMFHQQAEEPTDGAIRRFARRLDPASVRLYDLVARSDSNGRGWEWSPLTPSHKIYERAQQLNVAEKPLSPAIQGGELMEKFRLEDSPLLGRVVEVMYELQMDNVFTDHDAGITYMAEHQASIIAEAQRRTDEMLATREGARRERREALEQKNAEAKKLKQVAHLKRLEEWKRAKG